MDSYLVKTVELRKNYGTFTALQGLNLELQSGKIIGLLGPNGSGKTTLIKILAGLLTASEGQVLIDGKAPGYETKALVSYLPERPYFNSWMRVDECLSYFEDFYTDFDRTLAEKMLADLGVPVDKKLKALSKGTKEKVQLVLVMSRRAKLYLLDEPIAGVDPVAREYILKTIISAYHSEASVIISTHLITDVEQVLDEYAFIWNGRIVEQGDMHSVHQERGISLDDHFKEVFRCFPNS
ncbi:MAG: ABC transporter ATP-binding protein [Clostridia bacterium]|nr:ABC transporter ATP-binding protein [Clostridia bacterium]